MSEYTERVREQHGLFRNVPRSLRRAVERRLAALESDPSEFDREALLQHARLKRLHALLHIPCGERAKTTLFENPPYGSPRAALAQLAKTSDPTLCANLVRKHRMPYLLVESTLGTVSGVVAVALVETMPPEELLARLPLMARRGLIEAVRPALLKRLSDLAKSQEFHLPYRHIESVIRQADLDRTLSAALLKLVGAEPASFELSGDTALLIDASPSMTEYGPCLALAAETGWRIDSLLQADAWLYTVLVGTEAKLLDIGRGAQVDRWRERLTVTSQVPGTALGAGVERLMAVGLRVERLIIVTDGYENRPPRLVSALERYRGALACRPAIHLFQLAGAAPQLAIDLRNAKIPFNIYSIDRHLLGLDAALASLADSSNRDVVSEIINTPDT
jgi:hypothetical protein